MSFEQLEILGFASELWKPLGESVHWEPTITWAWTVCGVLIWLSHLAIPLLLFKHLRRTTLVGLLPWVAPFILVCGLGYLWDALTVWYPWYALVTASRVITALISVTSVLGLAYVLPSLMTPSVETALRSITVGEEAQEYVDSLLPLAAFVCSSDGGDLAVNSAYTTMLGYPFEEVRGHHYLYHVHPEERELVGDKWRAYCFGRMAAFKERFRWDHPAGELYLEVKGGHRSNGQHYGIVSDRTDEVLHSQLIGGQDHAME